MKYGSHTLIKRPHSGFSKCSAICLTLCLLLSAEQSNGVEKEQLIASGLRDQVEIVTDKWGITHIYAKNQKDLFFAQGYNAARDRLFQLEIWRRRALGLMSEIQGAKALQHDIGARLLAYRGDIQDDIKRIPDGEEIITSFVGGINAYIKHTRKRPELLPIEFDLLGIEPGFWTPEIVFSRHETLKSGAAEQELMVAELVSAIGVQKTEKILPFRRPPHLGPKDTIVLGDLDRDKILAIYRAAATPPKFTPGDIAKTSARNLGPRKSIENVGPRTTSLDPVSDPAQKANSIGIGSNHWVISGSNTASGAPILASDPHVGVGVPSSFYWTHLVSPGWNVIGPGRPALPGITVGGHNEHGAWGVTTFYMDQEDVYVYDVNPKNPNQYRYQGDWEDMRVISEQIPVKNRAPEKVELKYTRHGPILYEDREKNRAYALRAAWLDSGSPLAGSLRLNRAKNWEDFRNASAYLGVPALNVVWADRQGDIGWQVVGLTPLRVGWDGVLPVSGDGTYEWAGYPPIKSLPHVLNPPKGHWETANHYNVPDGYPNIFSVFSADPFRLNRIQEVFGAEERMTLKDSMALQNDELSIPARTLVPFLADLKPNTKLAAEAVKRVRDWNHEMNQTSVAAAIYAEWEADLQKTLIDKILPFEPSSYLLYLSKERTIDWLKSPETFFDTDPVRERNKLVASTFHRAVDNLAEKLGANIDSWQYGQEKMNHIRLTHLLSPAVNEEYQRKLDIGVVSKGGSDSTLNLDLGGPTRMVGPAFRMAFDAADWDKGVAASVPGQSGDPMSPHYSDLLESWVKGEYFPVYYSRKKIESVAEKKTYLVPEQLAD